MGCLGGPMSLGGSGPVGPLDKTALAVQKYNALLTDHNSKI